MTAADPETLKRLLVVHEHDRALDALKHRRATLPEFEEINLVTASVKVLAASAVEMAGRRHVLERDQKRLEDEVALLDARIINEEGRLYGGEVSAAKELQAFQEEITGLKARRSLLEDNVLDVMEAAEPVDAELAANRAEQEVLETRIQALSQAIGVAEDEIDAETESANLQRSEAAGGVGEELLAEYERLRSEPGRVAVARLVGSTCHGCHLMLAAVEVDRLKKLPADALIHCDECGCILVR
ncbi:MAG: zinc ribbon domain-containing protein [Acidimicrobiales bacterium]